MSTYRALWSEFIDRPRFQRLSTAARMTLLGLMLCQERGLLGLFRYYPALLIDRTGLSPEGLEAALAELETAQWIERDRDALCCWIRDALRDDPTYQPNNPDNVKGVRNALRGLPATPLTPRFCKHYGLTPSPGGGGPPGSSESDSDSDSDSDSEKEKGVIRLFRG